MAKTSRCKDAKGRQTSPTFFFSHESNCFTKSYWTLSSITHLLVRLLRQRRSRPFQLESEAGSGPVGSVPMLIRAGWNSSRGRVELQPPSHAWLDPQRLAARNSRNELQKCLKESRDSSSGCTRSISLYRCTHSLSLSESMYFDASVIRIQQLRISWCILLAYLAVFVEGVRC